MPVLIVHIIAAVLYLAAGALLLNKFKTLSSTRHRWLLATTGAAVFAHAIASHQLIVGDQGLHLQLFPTLSLVFLAVNTIVLLSALKKPVHNLFILLIPLTVLALFGSLYLSGAGEVQPLTLGLASHILLAITAYSLLTIATLQAVFLTFQIYRLKHKRALPPVGVLPPLQTMESLLFEMLWAGQILLTAAIISGALFVSDLLAQHMVHKTVFTVLAWCIYGVLLWGRHFLGWRGYTAIRWTLVGFACLMLAYFGSKLVLEFILKIG
ncbi:cytochrome c biogenesis protein CcsA [Gilvimarinus agarilyticus]|uniref:cytochrome C assembly family protein n=1 Tax=unclassified Gilvimarinus TaxID=2642066 RepID=UPI001C0A2D0C|nr:MULTISPECIES: cytochrome c biogenesis protein CcsA [unclassified Gilvimarinus]MBU2887056.1 cytochrome c biogenesis protein CcsA [Gilvimarinus agarilyticus]MDO6571716.1 cytochrome c biogenesis protein CcsA [Gilvimarinus sp. 2_MG-2023]MDO6745788.1 cytochrome c biogenesis protein CcsA [Gilvimarinus sp. 1_MG-2023]